jgi:hypothetical protein
VLRFLICWSAGEVPDDGKDAAVVVFAGRHAEMVVTNFEQGCQSS